MKHFSRKIKITLLVLITCLLVFVSFSKAGILFSANSSDVVVVSTVKKTFDPSNYVASMANASAVSTTSMTTTTTITTTTTTKTPTTTVTTTTVPVTTWTGDVLTKSKGVVNGPSGKETYYNLNMSVIINAMRLMGFTEAEYPYWVREDGVKMLGQYVMVAANYEIRPKGSMVESSLGMAIVCDTGSFVKNNPTQLDIAVTW